jgi:hypothetical protein
LLHNWIQAVVGWSPVEILFESQNAHFHIRFLIFQSYIFSSVSIFLQKGKFSLGKNHMSGYSFIVLSFFKTAILILKSIQIDI